MTLIKIVESLTHSHWPFKRSRHWIRWEDIPRQSNFETEFRQRCKVCSRTRTVMRVR